MCVLLGVPWRSGLIFRLSPLGHGFLNIAHQISHNAENRGSLPRLIPWWQRPTRAFQYPKSRVHNLCGSYP
jgi:hypothetical protein